MTEPEVGASDQHAEPRGPGGGSTSIPSAEVGAAGRASTPSLGEARQSERAAAPNSVDVAYLVKWLRQHGPHYDGGQLWEAASALEAAALREERLQSELARVIDIGKGFERDMRSHFQQSCVNLERADKAETEVERLREVVEAEWDSVALEDPHDACCGSSCTPNGCHETHPAGMVGVVAYKRFDTEAEARAFKARLDAAGEETAK